MHTATPVGTQHTAEYFRLRDGKIEAISPIFDATPWQPLPAAVTRPGARVVETTG